MRSRHRRPRPRPPGRVARSGVPSSRSSSRMSIRTTSCSTGRSSARSPTWPRCATTGRWPASTTWPRGSRGSRRCSGGTASSPPSRRSRSSRRFAVATLDVLARLQATTDDPWHDAEPGKILHEMRTGEMARAGETPHDAYYGSIDSTPLWLILLGEAHAWTGDDRAARAALAERPGGPRLDRRLGRPRWRRVRRVPAPLEARPAQPGLEGFGRRDPPHRRPAGRGSDRAGRGPGLRLRRQARDGPAGPPPRRDGAGGPARYRRRRPA